MKCNPSGDAQATGTPLWKAINPPPPAAVPLEGSVYTEVLIVGAGIAGLSLGFHLRSHGIDTVIVEAGDDASAATGASAGIIAPQLVRTSPAAVIEALGADTAGRFLRMLADSGRYTFALIERLGIECGARQCGFLGPTQQPRGALSPAQLIQEWRPFRNDLRLLTEGEVQEASGCLGYSSAVLDPTGGRLDPLAFSRGLAQAARNNGLPMYYGSGVRALDRSGELWKARTQAGEVTARRVVLCANGGNASLHPSLARTVLPLDVCEVATAPLPASMRRQILPGDQALTDTSADVFSIRFDNMGRLITAYPGPPGTLDAARISQVINRRLEAMLPGYRSTPLEHIWRGRAWLNRSLLPRVLTVETGLLAVQACNGRGLALNTIIGRELARFMADSTAEPPGVPLERPRGIKGFALARYLPGIMLGGAAMARAALSRVRRSQR